MKTFQYNSRVINKQTICDMKIKKFISLSYITELVQYNDGVITKQIKNEMENELL